MWLLPTMSLEIEIDGSGFQAQICDFQDQEELIMMMDFKDGAQRVIWNLSSAIWEEKSTCVLVLGATEAEGTWETRSVKKQKNYNSLLYHLLFAICLNTLLIIQSNKNLLWKYTLSMWFGPFCRFHWKRSFLQPEMSNKHSIQFF